MERNYKKIYFLGIGGIGMSALARYYMHEGCRVAGYDRTETPLTRALAAEGAEIHYEDDVELIPEDMRSASILRSVRRCSDTSPRASSAWQ